MADVIDRAQQRIEEDLERSIAAARGIAPSVAPTGRCLNCEAPLADGLRWCDTDCRDDYEALGQC